MCQFIRINYDGCYEMLIPLAECRFEFNRDCETLVISWGSGHLKATRFVDKRYPYELLDYVIDLISRNNRTICDLRKIDFKSEIQYVPSEYPDY